MTAAFVIQLALAWFFIVNVLVSVAVMVMAASGHDEAKASSHDCQVQPQWTALQQRSSRLLLMLRLMPAVASMLFVAALFIPAFLRLEPEGMRETLGRTATVLGVSTIAIVALSIARLVSHVRRTTRFTSEWSARATRVPFDLVPFPAYLVETEFPVMSLAGIVRPRLFIARQVVETLTPSELQTAVAHELAHLRARDNLKRLLCAAAPDLLGWTRHGRAIEASWRAAAEFSADDCAAAGDRRRAMSLASALVKVARLAVERPNVASACATQSMLHDGGSIAQRVERLVEPPALPLPRRRPGRLAIVSASAVLAGIASYELVLLAVHTLTEVLVKLP